MFLYNIPAHYLIIDPSFLPSESLRFFHVDRNWTDALVDGALRIGNNMLGIDNVRATIHKMISNYLYPSLPVTPAPQYPLYGFMIRSQVVTQYPDLKVSIQLKSFSDAAPILRHENIDVSKGVMICLLDQVPSDNGLQSITFTQPPHQQSFIAGAELDNQHITTWYKHIFTLKDQPPDPDTLASFSWQRSTRMVETEELEDSATGVGDAPHAANVFVWSISNAADLEIRTLIPGAWANDVNGVLNFYGTNPQDPQNPLYQDDTPNAALAGVQLNNPIYQLVIGKQTLSRGSSPLSGEFSVVDFPGSDRSALSPATSCVPGHQGGGSPGSTGQTELTHRLKPKAEKNRISTQSPGPRVGNGFDLGPGHGIPISPPPHSRPGRGASIGPLFGRPPRADEGPGAPQYAVSIFPSNNNPANPGIPTGTGIPLDLVISIVQTSPGDSTERATPFPTYHLKYFMIVFQLAAGDESRAATCLLDNYRGPGPFMLNNLRFNPLVQTEMDPTFGQCLALRVLPRSTKGTAVPDMCREMSFMLPVCRMLKHDITKRIPVWVTVQYGDDDPTTVQDWTIIQFPQK